MKKKSVILFIAMTSIAFLFSSCFLSSVGLSLSYLDQYPPYPAAVAVGEIVKIDDGTADYGLIGTVTYENDGKSYGGKFRLAKGHKYNSAMYEGTTVEIENSSIDTYSENDWETVLYDYVPR